MPLHDIYLQFNVKV